MALTQYTAATDIIESLGTTPEDRPGMTDAQLKAKFDENSANIKTYINAMIAEMLSTANGKGLSQQGLEDSAGRYTATNGEAALAEIAGSGRTTETVKGLSDLISTKVNPNVIINGCFRVNQRVKSGTVTLAAGVYGHDRWKAGASGCTYTFAASGGVTTLTITAGSLIQVVEGLNLETATYCLSWTGTATGKIGAGSLSASGVTESVTGGTDLSIEFSAGTLSRVKLEKGTVVTPFTKRAFGEELALCQRYFQKSYSYSVAPGTATIAGTTTQGIMTAWLLYACKISFGVQMRISPTLTLYSAYNASATGVASEYNIGGTFIADRASTTSDKNENGFSVSATAGAYTAGNYLRFQWIADAEI